MTSKHPLQYFCTLRRLWDIDLCSSFISYRTGHYKLHYYETPTSLKFVMVTDTKTNNLRIVLHQIYVSLYVEYGRLPLALIRGDPPSKLEIVVKNPLSPAEHPGGLGVNCELFELGIEQFVVSNFFFYSSSASNNLLQTASLQS